MKVEDEKLEGFKPNRFDDNPQEKKFHDEFIAEHNKNNHMDMIVFGHGQHLEPKDYLSEREKKIVVSTIQWLGSAVGEGFLNKLGYEKH